MSLIGKLTGKCGLTSLLLVAASLVCSGASIAQESESNGQRGIPESNEELLEYLQDQNFQASDIDSSSYAISGAELMAGPGPDDVAANLALMTFGDPVREIMDARFGGINANTNSGDITLITHLATITTSLALFFTSILLFAALAGGIIYTGKDGQLLGKDWDHKLFPLRASWHTAFLVPWPGFGGLCGIQVVVLFAGLLGLGIGSTVFKSGVNFLASGEQLVIYQNRDVIALSEGLMEASFCDAYGQVLNAQESGTYPTPGIEVRDHVVRLSGGAGPGATEVEIPQGVEVIVGRRACGSFLLDYETVETAETHEDVIKSALYAHLITDGAIADFYNTIVGIGTAENSFIHRIVDEQLNPSPTENLEILTQAEANSLEAAREAFYLSITGVINSDAVKTQITALNSDFIDRASRYGFAFFFRFYYDLTGMQEKTSAAVADVLGNEVVVPWDIKFCEDAWIDWFCDRSEKVAEAESAVNRVFKDLYRETNILYSNALGAMVDDREFSDGWLNNIIISFTQTLTELPRQTNPDPILEVKTLGDWMITITEGMFALTNTIKASADGAAVAASRIPVIDGIFEGIKSYVGSMIAKLWVGLIPLFGLGFTYAYIIPAIPIIFGYVAVFSFFIYWATALYHAPFWYAMGAMPKGDGLMGRAGSGYSMAVNLLLMPAFMIIGYFTGMVLMKSFGWLVSISFFDSIGGVHDAGSISGFGLTQLAGVFVVYGTVYTILIWKCFGLIFEISNELSKWTGSNHSNNFGEDHAKNAALTAAGAASTSVTQTAGNIKKNSDKIDKQNMSADTTAEANKSVSDGSPATKKAVDDTNRDFKNK
ncbi:DotA/TraY family protein [Alteromonas antoniana]|uniref:DotA/TraY family protein n=1 Tax=Alteromonas antoniana TaxID=2803813 RepID=UPI001C4879B6|nr:DotA/TraY family protein [Alteromonas antoniana]